MEGSPCFGQIVVRVRVEKNPGDARNGLRRVPPGSLQASIMSEKMSECSLKNLESRRLISQPKGRVWIARDSNCERYDQVRTGLLGGESRLGRRGRGC